MFRARIYNDPLRAVDRPAEEPKCERCGQDDLTANPECAFHGASRRPPTTEPAESEECGYCGYEKSNHKLVCSAGAQHHFVPTAPPAESVDAKALARGFLRSKYESLGLKNFGSAERRWAEDLATFAEQYAAKQIERQTPAIIERFVEEVEELVGVAKVDPIAHAIFEAMQTVKARRSGGEGK